MMGSESMKIPFKNIFRSLGISVLTIPLLMTATMLSTRSVYAIDRESLSSYLDDIRISMDLPGVHAAVRMPDGSIIRSSSGLADVEANIPLDDTIGMPGGSTGKSFVAALTMLMVEDGIISLDDHASRWLGSTAWYNELPNAGQIRVRHLLSHTSGIEDYPNSVKFWLSMIWRTIYHGSAKFSPEELIGFVSGRDPLFPVGEGFQYTDAGYLVLGRLIEAASGKNYYDVLHERILRPHGLDQVRPADRSILTNITPGYSGGARNLKNDGRMKFDPSSEWTGGGLVTNPTMLVRFYASLAEGKIVDADHFQQMLDAGWHNPKNPSLRYGFGLFVHHNGTSFSHGGLWPGYRTHVTHFVRKGITIAVQTNRDGSMDMERIVSGIAAIAL